MPSHSDTSHSRAHGLNILSARLGVSRKLLTGDVVLDTEGPAAHFYDAGSSNRTVRLPPFINGGGTLKFIANVGAANDLEVVTANALAVVTVEPGQATFVVASEAEWVALRASSTLGVFGPSGPGHSTGLVPDPGAVAGATRFLREDGSWAATGAIGITDGFSHITDGTNTADGSGADTFRLRSSDSSIAITVANNDVTFGDVANFTVNEANVDHDALLNFVANEHIDHTAVSINTAANSGLAGGGTIAASRSLSLDISNLTLDTPVLGDSFAFSDLSGGDTNKATLTTFNSILDHNALLNFVANKHIDHTLVSVQAGVGLTGGGDISATRTISLDINGLATDTIAVGDFLPFYDISGSDHNKITLANLNGSLDHNVLLNYVANQHTDHSTVSITAGSGLSGGGTIAATRTLTLDINGLAADTPVSGDFFSFWDISGSDNNKVSLANLVASFAGAGGAALTKTDDTNVTLTLGGAPTTALLSASSITLGWTGQLGPTRGGTGIGTYTQGDLLYSSAANTLAKLAAGTAGHVLKTGGAGANPAWAAAREVLTANRTYFVRSDGSDSNTGLVDSAGGAFLTLTKACNAIAALDLSTFNVDVTVRAATYTAGINVNGPWVGKGTVTFTGDTTTPSNVIISTTNDYAIHAENGAVISVQGFKVTCITAGSGVYVQYGGVVNIIGKMDYGAIPAGFAHLQATNFGRIISFNISHNITAGAGYHLFASYNGNLQESGGTITITGTPNFTTAYAESDQGSLIANGSTFSGSATGNRYVVTLNGVINTFGGGATYFPGNVAGSTATGGQYA